MMTIPVTWKSLTISSVLFELQLNWINYVTAVVEKYQILHLTVHGKMIGKVGSGGRRYS